MSKAKKTLLASAAVVTLGTGLLLAPALVSANESGSSNLVDKIATKFNLNKDEVQKVFDEEREARATDRQQKLSEYLQTKVDDKTITAEQKKLIEDKLQQMRDERKQHREEFKNLNEEERHQKMDELRDAFEQWAEDNNIPLEALDLPGPGRGHKGAARGPAGD